MNPRSPAPQASVLILTSRNLTGILGNLPNPDTVTRLRAQTNGIRYEDKIINSLLQLKNKGLYDNTLKTISQKLNQLSRNSDLMKPSEVLTYIANLKVTNSTRQKLANCYEYFCRVNTIEFQKPKYRCEETVPIIPTTENVTKIISASSRRFATIFTIMTETAVEGEELHQTQRNNIDLEQGIISIKGKKNHASGTYRLKPRTIEMLREYIAKNPQNKPFPKPQRMADAWRKIRDRLACNLKQPELRNIPLKNLRNYAGAQFYYRTQDPIATMRFMRHKKLETTMHYIRAITITGEEEYTCKAARTQQEITALAEAGFTKFDEIDGIHLYRKRK